MAATPVLGRGSRVEADLPEEDFSQSRSRRGLGGGGRKKGVPTYASGFAKASSVIKQGRSLEKRAKDATKVSRKSTREEKKESRRGRRGKRGNKSRQLTKKGENSARKNGKQRNPPVNSNLGLAEGENLTGTGKLGIYLPYDLDEDDDIDDALSEQSDDSGSDSEESRQHGTDSNDEADLDNATTEEIEIVEELNLLTQRLRTVPREFVTDDHVAMIEGYLKNLYKRKISKKEGTAQLSRPREINHKDINLTAKSSEDRSTVHLPSSEILSTKDSASKVRIATRDGKQEPLITNQVQTEDGEVNHKKSEISLAVSETAHSSETVDFTNEELKVIADLNMVTQRLRNVPREFVTDGHIAMIEGYLKNLYKRKISKKEDPLTANGQKGRNTNEVESKAKSSDEGSKDQLPSSEIPSTKKGDKKGEENSSAVSEELKIIEELNMLTRQLRMIPREFVTDDHVIMIEGYLKNLYKRKISKKPATPSAGESNSSAAQGRGQVDKKAQKPVKVSPVTEEKRSTSANTEKPLPYNPASSRKEADVPEEPEIHTLDGIETVELSSEKSEIHIPDGNETLDSSTERAAGDNLTSLTKEAVAPEEPEVENLDGIETLESPSVARPLAQSAEKRKPFQDYLPQETIDSLLSDRKAFQGKLRVNPRCFELAFVTVEGFKTDFLIRGRKNRNRAFHNDEVVIELVRGSTEKKPVADAEENADGSEGDNDSEEADNEEPLVTDLTDGRRQEARVIGLVSKCVESRLGSGTIQIRSRSTCYDFFPSDMKAPRAVVREDQIPKALDIKTKGQEGLTGELFLAKYGKWSSRTGYPYIESLKYIGETSDISAQTKAILLENGICHTNFSDKVVNSLPSAQFEIPAQERKNRLDLTTSRIFSIDPETARDLDDALSVSSIGDGLYKVGVHIADVSNFVKASSAVDIAARSRCTSVYLVQRVIPMLPRLLCENLCSLNPDVERLAFSVVWIMDSKGQIKSTWFGRSIIRSCSRLTYDQAQRLIDCEAIDSEESLPKDVDDIKVSGGFGIEEIRGDVRALHNIAQSLRKSRFDAGALTLSTGQLSFKLDDQREFPLAFRKYEYKQSNHLVEEFMLLANMSVAHFISDAFPDFAPLRRHPPPQTGMIERLAEWTSDYLGFKLEFDSSKQLQYSLNQLKAEKTQEQADAIEALLTKPMQEALYFCSGEVAESEWMHYGLCVPRYTHFTSPIRRYVDLLVHRVLQMAIDLFGHERKAGEPLHGISTGQSQQNIVLGKARGSMKEILDLCNEKNTAAGVAEKQSQEMFLRLLLGYEWKEFVGTVVDVSGRSLNVHVSEICSSRIFYFDRMTNQGCDVEVSSNDKTVTIRVAHSQEESPSCAEGEAEENDPGAPTESNLTKRQRKRLARKLKLGKIKKSPQSDNGNSQEVCVDRKGADVRSYTGDPITSSLKLFSSVTVLIRAQDDVRADLECLLLLE